MGFVGGGGNIAIVSALPLSSLIVDPVFDGVGLAGF